MAPQNSNAVMVLTEIENEVVVKVSRVYKDAKAAMKYKDELEKAIESGSRKDLLAVWIQTNVRLY